MITRRDAIGRLWLPAAAVVATLAAGCKGKDTTTEAAPPPGPGAVADPPNPGKLQRLPGARTPAGG